MTDMRVLVVPDRCDDLPSVEVARLVSQGWSERNPEVEVQALPLAAGDRGFVSALAASLPGRLEPVTATDAWGCAAPCTLLLVERGRERVVYLESAQVAGGSVRGRRELPAPLGTYGVGELIASALDLAATRIVIGVGGLAALDGGRGAVAALAGRAAGETPDPAADLPAARARLGTVGLTAAVSTDPVLLGMQGACAGAVDELRLTRAQAQEREQEMGEYVDLARRIVPERTDLLTGKSQRVDRQPGAGAGGGLGYGLALLAAQLTAGPALVAATVDLAGAVAGADLVVTATQVFDWRVLEHSVLQEVAAAATAVARPVVVLAQEVQVGRRETMSLGVSGAYALVTPGRRTADDSGDLGEGLRALARRVAGTWTPPGRRDVP
ncbi:glycerate kinase [Leekyejoonella antrihumi]|nr:glycerate kinase [Leekyejoonella antrihumi]